MKRPFGAIAGSRPGPILVVGGGMSTLQDLTWLQEWKFSAVISANGHAFKIPDLGVDFIVCKDHYHSETKKRMEPQLREHGVPIISRHFWADYRLLEWHWQGNSGLMAIAVAAALGGGPIFPVGFDFYTKGTYFHDPNAKSIGIGKSMTETRRKILKIAEVTIGTEVRPVSGPLCEHFKQYPPHEFTKPYLEPYVLAHQRNESGYYVRSEADVMNLPFDPRAQILRGKEFWVSSRELKNSQVGPNVKVLDSYPPIVR